MASKAELLHYLEQHVFNPILNTKPEGYSGADRKKLEDVQRRTESEKERFHNYRNAAELIENYKRDLHSQAAKHVNQELEALRLPTLPSVREEFLRLAGEQDGQNR